MTRDTNARFDEAVFAVMKAVAHKHYITPLEARNHPEVIEALARVTSTKNNRPDGTGTGLLNGDPNAEQYVQSGSVPLDKVSRFLLCSDGGLPIGLSPKRCSDRADLFHTVARYSAAELIARKRWSEKKDPHWQQQIRFKGSDDGAVLYGEVVFSAKHKEPGCSQPIAGARSSVLQERRSS
jgi:hypothetical protein